MSYYENVYKRRLNRFGLDYQTRLQQQREKVFEDLLLKSIYRVDFEYDGEVHPGLLERYQQDDTKTIQRLLTRVSLDLPHGTVLSIPDKDGEDQYWMIYYYEQIQASGYNRYYVLKMSHDLTWYLNNDFQSTPYTSKGYVFGPHMAAIRDALKTLPVLYQENNNSYTIMMPYNEAIKHEGYIEVKSSNGAIEVADHYRIIGVDGQSNPGVIYVTMDPIYSYDKTEKPEKQTGDTDEEFYWLDGGNS